MLEVLYVILAILFVVGLVIAKSVAGYRQRRGIQDFFDHLNSKGVPLGDGVLPDSNRRQRRLPQGKPNDDAEGKDNNG